MGSSARQRDPARGLREPSGARTTPRAATPRATTSPGSTSRVRAPMRPAREGSGAIGNVPVDPGPVVPQVDPDPIPSPQEEPALVGTLGPGPATPRPDPTQQMSPARAAVLERLGSFHRPATVMELAAACDQHPNTIREHLDALIGAGLVSRSTAPARGRGRPAILYRAEPVEPHRPQVREYSILGVALAAHVRDSLPDPGGFGFQAGLEQGRSLCAPEERTVHAARRACRAIFSAHGFAPQEGQDGMVRLYQCPILEAARAVPEVVCAVHGGVIAGIFEAHGAKEYAPRLKPFAVAGACLVVEPDATDGT